MVATMERTATEKASEILKEAGISRVRVPADTEFEDQDFMLASDLDAIARVIRREFGMPHSPRITVVWKRKGGNKKSKAALAYCDKLSGLAKYYSGQDFIVWVAADHAATYRLSDFQFVALLHHELQHAAVDEEDKPMVVGHDVEAFASNIAEFGLWAQDLERVAPAFEQAKLIA